jgi:hypothetical protein
MEGVVFIVCATVERTQISKIENKINGLFIEAEVKKSTWITNPGASV